MGIHGPIGMEVNELHSAGTSMAGRSGHAQTHANGLKTGVDDATGSVGHAVVKSALNSLLTDHILDPAIKLPGLVGGGGEGIANVAATGRDSDNEGGSSLAAPIAQMTDGGPDGLHRRINYYKLPD